TMRRLKPAATRNFYWLHPHLYPLPSRERKGEDEAISNKSYKLHIEKAKRIFIKIGNDNMPMVIF
ncbi:MAG: hypothetical protein ABIL86_11105, partial [candidate division WOR-3 bacterium]